MHKQCKLCKSSDENFCMSFNSYNIFSELICAFGCIINKVFPFLVTVTTCIAVSFDGDWNIDFWLLIFGTIIVFVLNLLFMKRKDFLN